MRTRKILMRMGVLLVVLGLAYGGLDLAGAAGPPSIVTGMVTVANDATNPVPVQQQGTSTVAGKVGIDPAANTVQLAPTDTVQTSAADNPAFQPVSASCTTSSPLGSASCSPEFTTGGTRIPAGKELVVTSVSMTAQIPLGKVLEQAIIDHSLGGVGSSFNLPIGSPQTDDSGSYYNAGLATQFYADSSSPLNCGWQVTSGGTVTNATCSIDGYLVTLP